MKINEILTESPTDLTAHAYPNAEDDFDELHNREANTFATENRDYYNLYFKEFFSEGIPPVFDKVDNHIDEDAEDWDAHPQKDEIQSAGFRGKQHALERAGIPHETPDKYDPAAQLSQMALTNAQLG